MKNIFLQQLTGTFQDADSFSRQELLDFYRRFDPDINDGTFGWKIYELKRKNILENVGTGVYRMVRKKVFRPEVTTAMRQAVQILDSGGADIKYNIWDTTWLNEFIELQIFHSLIILETDKSSMEDLFYKLKDRKKNVFLKPDESTIERYVSELNETIILKPMISRSPTLSIHKTVVPSLEKILVDLFCDEKIFFAYQGYQLKMIYANSFEKYTINLSRMVTYAKRRKREESLKLFLLETIPENLKNLLE